MMKVNTKMTLALLVTMGWTAGANTRAQQQPVVAAKQASVDCYGDPLPSGAIARLGTVRFRHGRFLRDMILSPDGRMLISAGGNAVNIWDVQTGRKQRQFSFDNPLGGGLTLSPDGKLLAVCQQIGNKMRFWDPTSGKEVFPFGDSPPRAWRAVLSPRGELLATLDAVRPATVTIWDMRKGKKIQTIASEPASSWEVHTLAFSPNGQLLVFPSLSGVRVWDLVAGKELYALDLGTKTGGGCVAFSPDGKQLAAARHPAPNGTDAAIYLWDMTTGKRLGALKGHERYLYALAMSPKNNVLASTGGDGKIRFWDVQKQQEIGQADGPRRSYFALQFSADGNVLVSGELFGVLRIWDASTHKELAASAARSNSLHWASFMPDGQNLISTESEQIVLWEPLTGKPRPILHSPDLFLSRTALSPDGKTLATIDRIADQIVLWDITTGKLRRRLGEIGKRPLIYSCTFSPDSRRLASGSYREDIIRIWDVDSGKELQQLKGQKISGVLAFAPDGTTLVSGSGPSRGDYTIRLWKLATGEEIWRKTTSPLTPFAVTFSPDGHTLAVAGGLPGRTPARGMVHLWEAATGKELKHLEGHREPVECMAFTADGRMLASGSDDNTIRLWEIATGKERRCLQGHQNRISTVSFSPDGRLLASASVDTTALVWDLTGRFREGRFQTRRLSAAELHRCWNDFAEPDAVRAYQSICALIGSPKEIIAFLKDHLPPMRAANPERVAPLLAALDSEQFTERDKARTELEHLGLAVEPALHAALDRKPSLEVRRRIETILDKLAGGPRMRYLRALEVLEHIDTEEARQVLETLSAGTTGMWPTQEAKASLIRLKARPIAR